jgi:hypothetical protein
MEIIKSLPKFDMITLAVVASVFVAVIVFAVTSHA